MTLLEVIANAGSTTPDASNTIIVQRYKDGIAAAVSAPEVPGDTRWAEVTRINLEELREGKLSANLLLQDSDMIFVPTAERYYVSGFVRTPGSFVLRPGMTVRQAIAEAGGLTERGSQRGMKILRKGKGEGSRGRRQHGRSRQAERHHQGSATPHLIADARRVLAARDPHIETRHRAR